MSKISSTVKVFAFAAGIGTLLVLAVYFGLRPISWTDGVDNYSGQERAVAGQGLDEANKFRSSGIESVGSIGILKRRVVRVDRVETPKSGVYANCGAFYEVYLEDVGLFGVVLSAKDYRPVCVR